MDEKQPITANVPFAVYEGIQARAEQEKKTIIAHCEKETRRAHILCIILIAVILLCNIGWLVGIRLFISDFLSEYEIAVEQEGITVEAEGGNANYIGNDGDIYNGTSNSQSP